MCPDVHNKLGRIIRSYVSNNAVHSLRDKRMFCANNTEVKAIVIKHKRRFICCLLHWLLS